MAANTKAGNDAESANPAQISDAETNEIVDELVDEMGQLFHGYLDGVLAFEELSFEMFDTLRTLHALATGNVIIEYEDAEDVEFAEFDELVGEPTGASTSAKKPSGPASTPKSPGHKPRGRK